MGATIQDQKNCETTPGHHSHPEPCAASISAGVPWTSVPGIPQEAWYLREINHIRTVRNTCRMCWLDEESNSCRRGIFSYLNKHRDSDIDENLGSIS